MHIPRRLLLLVAPLLLVAATAHAAPAMAVAEATGPVADATAPYTLQPARLHGYAATHEVTIVMIAPQGTRPDYTPDGVAYAMRQVDAYWGNETNGQVRFHVASIQGWVTPGDTSLRCDSLGDMIGFAKQYANWSPGPNKHLMAMVPSGRQCGGFSNGGEPATLNDGEVSYVSYLNPGTLAHELGHNLTLQHLASTRCADGWDFDGSRGVPSSCTHVEYGDGFDIMSDSGGLFAAAAPTLDVLGLIQNRAVPACGATRRIPIQTMSAGYDGQRIIAWKDPRQPATTYYVEYRDQVDWDEYQQVVPNPRAPRHASGVRILRTDPSMIRTGTVLERPGDQGADRQLIRAGEQVALNDGMSVTVAGIDEGAHTAAIDVYVPCR